MLSLHPFNVSSPEGSSVLIAPFWDNTDYETGGQVYYRFSSEQNLVNKIAANISNAFGGNFNPVWAFVATWYDMLPQFDDPSESDTERAVRLGTRTHIHIHTTWLCQQN